MSNIDEEQYEAAKVDGASRMQRIRYITIPGLMSTYFVLLLLSIANLINNGMEQYFVFQNAMNKQSIEVLDLYVYNQGMVGSELLLCNSGQHAEIGCQCKSALFANKFSILVRGESVV